jgi:two-component system LytT family response regulator
MKLRVYIVDDEPPARERLRRMLAERPDVEVVGEAGDGVRALEGIAASAPDLVLLDIDLPELSGLEVARALSRGGPAVVFVTAYDAHAVQAFDLEAVDYLLKPIGVDRLAAALERTRARKPAIPDWGPLVARLERGGAPCRMALKCGAKYIVFDSGNVSAIVARDHYSAVLVEGRELLADDTLDELARRLDAQIYVRVHRGAIINLRFLKELVHEGDRRYVAVLSDPLATRVPVSRERLGALKAMLSIN